MLVEYEDELWPGQVTSVAEERATVKCYEKAELPRGSTWKWPAKDDEHDYPLADIKQKIETPIITSFRSNVVRIPELAGFWK